MGSCLLQRQHHFLQSRLNAPQYLQVLICFPILPAPPGAGEAHGSAHVNNLSDTLRVLATATREGKEGWRRHRDMAMGHELQLSSTTARRWRLTTATPTARVYPNPALAWAIVPSRSIPLVSEIRQNKGLHGTAHNGSHQNLWGTLYGFRHQNSYSMCAVPVSPDVQRPENIGKLR